MVSLHSLSQRTKQLVRWRRNALAFGAGVLLTLTLPPVFALPLLIPAFTLLYWLVDGAPTGRRAFADGWWFGMGWHVTGLYWFCIALLTDPEAFAWLIPFTVIGLNGIIALYAGIACWLWKKSRISGAAGVLAFPIFWTLVEFARGHLFGGFPWNLAGYAFATSDALMQPAALVGIYGLTWFAVLLGVVPAALANDNRPARYTVGGAYGLLVVAFVFGQWQLGQAPQGHQPGIMLRLVQANISQHHRWDPKLRRQWLDEHMRLTRQPGINNVTLVVWPETSVPYAFRPNDGLPALIGHELPPKTRLLAGGIRIEGNESDWKMFNSIVAIDQRGATLDHYDKVRLVPFGEFVPFRSVLPKAWLTPAGERDFSTGPKGATLAIPDEQHAALPLICYEVIFPEMLAHDPSFPPPTWILNVTNDAWFGMSSGPHQHFHMARFRAVEQGLPLVRVANTGITALVDVNGRVLSKIGLGEKGVIDVLLPQPRPEKNLYSRWGDWLLIVLIFGLLILRINQFSNKNN